TSSLDQRLVGEPLADGAGRQAAQPLQRVALHVAVVEAERELINVTAKVLLAGVVIDADDAALEHGKGAFDAVGGHAAPDELAFAVVDRLMVEEQPSEAAI